MAACSDWGWTGICEPEQNGSDTAKTQNRPPLENTRTPITSCAKIEDTNATIKLYDLIAADV